METRTITEEFLIRMDNEMRYHGRLYQKEGEPFQSEALTTAAGSSFPAVDLWHGLWYRMYSKQSWLVATTCCSLCKSLISSIGL